MKRFLSLFLFLAILLSCFACAGVFAAGEEQGTAQAFLLGDADLDGEITVYDATLIQRSLVSLDTLDGLQTALANVDGDGVSIMSATLIQRYLVNIPTGCAIGEAAGDENEGVVYSEEVVWYAYNPPTIIEDTDTPVYFSTAYPGVPFISDSYVMLLTLGAFGYYPFCTPEAAQEGLCHIYDLPMGTTVAFDYDHKIICFSDYTSTLSLNGYMSFNPFMSKAPVDCLLYHTADSDLYYGGDPFVVTFAYDEVPMLRSGDQILIPLQTMSDLFLSYAGAFFQYNGTGIYGLNSMINQSPAFAEYYQQYCDTAVKTDTITPALAQVNYYELCNCLDAHYGLQEAHNIESFDAFFARKGIKARMLSTDLATVEKAQQDICTMLFEDFHSGYTMGSVFLTEKVVSDSSESPVFLNRKKKFDQIATARKHAIGATLGEDFPYYERIGDTVFITFDGFTFSGTPEYYYSEYFVPTADGNTTDTIDLFRYALERLKNEDSDAKNVVIDLACNGGGAVIACAYAMQAICGQSMVIIQNPNTWALHQIVLRFDLNLDGVIDENDRSMLEMGFNVAVNTSDSSFSCGNLLPCMLDSLDDRILLTGQQSGGGSCAVGHISTAIGSLMQISSEARFSTMKNGYIRDIDGGVAPDVYLSLNRMFDREYIIGVLHEQFGD